MQIKNLTILSIFAITLFAGCDNKDVIDDNIIAKQQEVAVAKKVEEKREMIFPSFKLVTSDGKSIKIIVDPKVGWRFEGLGEKVVLLDFFGTWCPPCKAEIPHLNNIRKKLNKNFEILGIDIGSRGGTPTTPEFLEDFIYQFGIKYPIATGGDNGKLFSAVRELNPNGSITFMLLFNKKGEFVKHYIGMISEEILTSDIQQTIKMK